MAVALNIVGSAASGVFNSTAVCVFIYGLVLPDEAAGAAGRGDEHGLARLAALLLGLQLTLHTLLHASHSQVGQLVPRRLGKVDIVLLLLIPQVIRALLTSLPQADPDEADGSEDVTAGVTLATALVPPASLNHKTCFIMSEMRRDSKTANLNVGRRDTETDSRHRHLPPPQFGALHIMCNIVIHYAVQTWAVAAVRQTILRPVPGRVSCVRCERAGERGTTAPRSYHPPSVTRYHTGPVRRQTGNSNQAATLLKHFLHHKAVKIHMYLYAVSVKTFENFVKL